MDILKTIVNKKILLHISFWLLMLILIFSSENLQYGTDFQLNMLFHFLIAFVSFAAISYFNIYYLIPKFFMKKKYWKYIIFLIICIIAGSSIPVLAKNISEILGYSSPLDWKYHNNENLNYYFHILTGAFSFVAFTTFVFILEEWIRLQSIKIEMKEIETERTQSELQALKAQINPHFLFNTLNNIYSHSLVNSPKTPEMILKLSDLMSYILYECHVEKVAIESEIAFIRNYLELEKVRYEDQIDIETAFPNTTNGLKISPLLLIPFIENAFKHGNSNGATKKYVHVKLSVDGETLHFSIENSIDPTTEQLRKKESGIGIENVQKRLELLYPNRHLLRIDKGQNVFTVELKITEHGN